MALRFRKSVQIIPGLRLNFSKSGISSSLGVKGARVTFSKHGAYSNVGLPGTGLYMRERIFKKNNPKLAPKTDGIKMVDEHQSIFDPYLEIERLNKYIEDVINIGHKTPAIDDLITYPRETFPVNQPIFKPNSSAVWYPALWGVAFLFIGSLAGPIGSIASCGFAAWYSRKRIFSKQEETFNNTELVEWQSEKTNFENEQDAEQHDFESALDNADKYPDKALEAIFNIIEWPRETNISFEINEDVVLLDVDLPEIEDMPKVKYSLKGRGSNKDIVEEEKSDTQQRKDYANHIHGIGMLLCGIVFNTLERVKTVVISAYTQRISSASGQIDDEYLYSVCADRDTWQNINLDNVECLDPVDVLGSFNTRRNMTKTGIFKAIEPFGNE